MAWSRHRNKAIWREAAAAGHNHTGIYQPLDADLTAIAAIVVADGDIIIGNSTPAWSKLAISIPAANVRNVLGIDNGELRPSWKTALDAVVPTTIAESAAAAAGTSLIFSHRDHTHGAPATWAATAHNLLSAKHGDTTTASCVLGDIITGQAGPVWARLAITVPAAGTLNYIGVNNGETVPSWKSASANPGAAAAILQSSTTGGLTLASLTDSGLTPTRVVFAGAGGLLSDAAGFTYVAGLLSTTGAVAATTGRFSGLTDGYVPWHMTDATGLGNSSIFTDSSSVNIGGVAFYTGAKLSITVANFCNLAIGQVTTNATAKYGMICGAPYTNASKSWSAIGISDDNAARTVIVGGGGLHFPDANAIYFYTAAAYNQTDDQGALRLVIAADGTVAVKNLTTAGFVTNLATGVLQTNAYPVGDHILFWDDTAGALAWLDVSTGLSISGTNLTASQALLSASHTDTLADSVLDGDVIIGNVTPKWSRLAIAIPAAGTCNYLGINNGELRPSWKAASASPGAAAKILQSSTTGGLTLASTIQATTGLFTDLDVGHIPYHVSDALGLADSPLYYSVMDSFLMIQHAIYSPLNLLDINSNGSSNYGLCISDRGALACELVDEGGGGGAGSIIGRLSLYKGDTPAAVTKTVELNAEGPNWLTYQLGLGTDTVTVGYILDVNGTALFRGLSVTITDNLTDDTDKSGVILLPHYSSAVETEGVCIIKGQMVDDGRNYLYLGGGDADSNACTIIFFYCANDWTTRTGTEIAHFDLANGLIMAPNKKICVDHIAEKTGTHAIVFDSTTEATTMHTTTLLADHIGEHTGAHGIVLDNVLSASSAGIGINAIPTTVYAGWSSLQIGNTLLLAQNTAAASHHTCLTQNAYLNAAGSWARISTDVASIEQQSSGEYYWFGDASGVGGATFTPTQRMHLTVGGILQINHIAELTVSHGVVCDSALTVVGAFGCNAAAAQTAYASGGALAAYTTGAFGLNSDANMSALHALVVKMRAALVANGIMS